MDKACDKCGELKPHDSKHFSLEKWGLRGTCRKCRSSRQIQRLDETPGARDRIHAKQKEASRPLSNMRKDDRARGRDNNLNVEYVREQLKSPCVYCGFPSTSLDRIDNKLGHLIGNCLPCCGECNVARSDHFTVEEMRLIGQVIRQIKLNRDVP